MYHKGQKIVCMETFVTEEAFITPEYNRTYTVSKIQHGFLQFEEIPPYQFGVEHNWDAAAFVPETLWLEANTFYVEAKEIVKMNVFKYYWNQFIKFFTKT